MLYKYGGDKTILVDNLSAIKKYLEFVESSLNEKGMITGGFGDREEFFTEESSEYTTTPTQSSTLVAIKLFNRASEIAKILGDKEFFDYCLAVSEKIKRAFEQEYVRDGELQIKTQTAYALAIDGGIFGGKDKEKAINQLKRIIHENGDRAKVGIIGFGVLYDVLSDNGEKELAYKIAMSEEYPGFLYTINMGVTSMWESYSLLKTGVNEYVRVDEKKKPSFNHHWYGHISAWIFKNIGGLKIDYTKDKPFVVEINENLPLDSASVSFHNGNDFISVKWKKVNGKIRAKIKSNREYEIIKG
jgi:alpha-L-rhamnosidase